MTDKYAVIGNPISHSKSPLIHRMFAEQTGQDISYEAIEAPLDGFAAKIEELRAKGYKGCNVTVPFKFEAFKLAIQLGASVNPRAAGPGAANTLKFDDARMFVDNTDGTGLVNDLERNLGFSIRGKRILMVGAGGAAWGVLVPILDEKPKRLVLSNRTIVKAEDAVQILSSRFGDHIDSTTEFIAKSFSELGNEEFDLVVNATSAGLSDSALPLPETIFAPGALAYDMMYGRETPFMAFARAHEVRVADGLGMLVEQAAEAFHIWRGVRPDTKPVFDKLRLS
jgi:shikimate dehydrogenase